MSAVSLSDVPEAPRCAECHNVIGGSGVYDPIRGEMLCVACDEARLQRVTREAELLATVPPIEPRPFRFSCPLSRLVICVGCDAGYEADGGPCPSCGSTVAFAVSRVIAPKDAATPWRKP